MAPCTNCFSGCVNTISDKCIKYTGNSIDFLGITTGDSLEAVENAITDYLATVYSGAGIFPVITPGYICTIVDDYLPASPTLVDILTAIVRAICAIEAEIVVERARIDVIEDTYDVDCLTVDPDAGTHAVLEVVIADLCTAIGDITTLENLFATCITTSTIDTYIQNYLDTISTTNLMYTKMVPYVIYPFYPSVAVMSGAFDINGVGLGTWDKIYLCNGYAGLTPDLRGRSLIGTTDMGGGSLNPVVDPNFIDNPAYYLGTEEGANSIVLSPTQIASHTHVATTTVTDPGHYTHIKVALAAQENWDDDDHDHSGRPINRVESLSGPNGDGTEVIVETTTKEVTGITAATINTVNYGGFSHPNIHPVHACYYIMYVP